MKHIEKTRNNHDTHWNKYWKNENIEKHNGQWKNNEVMKNIENNENHEQHWKTNEK